MVRAASLDAALQIVDDARDEQAGGRVQQDDVPSRAGFAAQDALDDPGVLVGRAATESRRRGDA